MRVVGLVVALLVFCACSSSLQRARTARDQGDLEDARTLYERAMKESAFEPLARRELASMLAQRGDEMRDRDPGRAESLYEQALELDPVNAPALTGYVRMLRRRGELDRADEVVAEAAEGRSCGACKRLALVLLLDRADRAMQENDWNGAIEHYTAAQKLRSQPRAALAIAKAHLLARQNEQAALALEAAAPLLRVGDVASMDEFSRLRRALVLAALEGGDVALSDQARVIMAPGDDWAELVELARLVPDALMEAGRIDEALTRYQDLLSGDTGVTLPEDEREDVRARVVNLYANQGTAYLHDGRAEQAAASFDTAIELDPDDPALRLQRLLAVSETLGATEALRRLETIPRGAVGWSSTHAILSSLRVLELIEGGNLRAAKTVLVEAQETGADLPEVHLAAAWVLAQTPFDLWKRERAALTGSASMVHYRGEVYSFGEALGEIDWIRDVLADRSAQYLFTAPWLWRRTEALEKRIRSVYPFVVEFMAEPEPQLVLDNRGAEFLEISLRGPDTEEELGIAAGGQHKVSIAQPGVVTLRIGGRRQVLLAEPYAQVTVPVGD